MCDGYKDMQHSQDRFFWLLLLQSSSKSHLLASGIAIRSNKNRDLTIPAPESFVTEGCGVIYYLVYLYLTRKRWVNGLTAYRIITTGSAGAGGYAEFTGKMDAAK